MDKYIYDDKNGLWYELQGDYYIPCLILPAEKEQPIGLWGQRHLRYLKEYRRATYIGSLIQLVGPQLGGHFIGNFDIFIMGVPRVKVLQIDSSHYIFLRSDFCCGWTI